MDGIYRSLPPYLPEDGGGAIMMSVSLDSVDFLPQNLDEKECNVSDEFEDGASCEITISASFDSVDILSQNLEECNASDEFQDGASFERESENDESDLRGVVSFKIPASMMKEATENVQKAQLEREKSSIPKPIVPFLESLLPRNNTFFAEFEADAKQAFSQSVRKTNYVDTEKSITENNLPGTGDAALSCIVKGLQKNISDLLFDNGADITEDTDKSTIIPQSIKRKVATMHTGAPKMYINPPAFVRDSFR